MARILPQQIKIWRNAGTLECIYGPICWAANGFFTFPKAKVGGRGRLAAKPHYLSWFPGTHMLVGENRFSEVIFWPLHALCSPYTSLHPTHIHMHTMNVINNSLRLMGFLDRVLVQLPCDRHMLLKQKDFLLVSSHIGTTYCLPGRAEVPVYRQLLNVDVLCP